MIHVIEFQKRGLPHGHFLIILKHGSKIRQPKQFDKFVCVQRFHHYPSHIFVALLCVI